jgi:hypothetical protein
MIRKKTLLLVALLLIAAVCIAGCAMNFGTPASTQAPIPVPTTVLAIPPTITAEPTTVPLITTIVTTAATIAPAEKVVLHETGILTTKTYKTYDFKTLMGYKFLYPKDKFRITIKSEKPVLGYAMSTTQSGQLQGSQLIPRYQTYQTGVDWGLIEPVMVIEKATDTTKEFTLKDVGPLTYVVDGRWMGYDSIYDNTPPFTYEITIVKTGGPTQQNFDFAGLQSEETLVSRTKSPEPLPDSN